jgi:hypothetical protein
VIGSYGFGEAAFFFFYFSGSFVEPWFEQLDNPIIFS